ncbi:MAG TPA: hypothetical protein VJB14_15625, partial [Planctomycetota bacterium]|nr:hypothetical protein [Planctomycetota bacterium]
ETPTKIYHRETGRNPRVSDVVLLILLTLTQRKWEEFADDGVFVSKVIPNPVFCINWDRTAKFKVQARFQKLIAE